MTVARVLESLSEMISADQLHQPDCSSVTDQELISRISPSWSVENGVANISYSFSRLPFYSHFISSAPCIKALPEYVSSEVEVAVKATIRFLLDQWTKASNGALIFFENINPHPFSQGIYFYLGGSSEHFDQAYSANAFAHNILDQNGQLNQAFIFLPNDEELWFEPRSYSTQAILHEIGHGLGLKHLHTAPTIKEKLEQTLEGIYCSLMAYPHEIFSPISDCHGNCDPDSSLPYTTWPGALDQRSIRLAYSDNHINELSYENYFLRVSNLAQVTFYYATTIILHNSIAHNTQKLMRFYNKPAWADTSAIYIVADATFLLALMGLNFPTWVSTLFTWTAATKYLPKTILEKLPVKISLFLTSNYSLYTLNLSFSLLNTREFIPSMTSSLISLTMSHLTYSFLQQQPVPASDSSEARPESSVKQVVIDIEPEFNTRKEKRSSFCTYLCSFFKTSPPRKSLSREQTELQLGRSLSA